MDNTTYDVRVWEIDVYKGTTVTTYWVRWKTGTAKPWKEPFRHKTQAKHFRSTLLAAASKGEAFDLTTGRPVSSSRRTDTMTWYDFCVLYVDMKWKHSSAKRRATIAWALVTLMPPMIATPKSAPEAKAIRRALRQWGFNTKRREECPDDAAAILLWLSRNTKPVAAITEADVLRAVLDTADTLLNGHPAAAWTARGNRGILANALDYAVEKKLLDANPVKASTTKRKAPKAAQEIDRRCVVNHMQARRLLAAVRKQSPSGPRLTAFYAVIYYAGLRPEEAVSLGTDNITLPPLVLSNDTGRWEEPADNWGELRFCTAAPESGAEWTDDGATREHRQLKSRAVGEWRRVPVAPPLTRLLRTHLNEFVTGTRVFSGVEGGELPSITYRRVWDNARKSALTPNEYPSPLAKRVYDLRHACVSTWLNGGIAPAQVAEWAGHSVAVLLKIYAKCIDGQDDIAKRRIEEALGEPDEPKEDASPDTPAEDG